jgi:hypothetical protein
MPLPTMFVFYVEYDVFVVFILFFTMTIGVIVEEEQHTVGKFEFGTIQKLGDSSAGCAIFKQA